MTKVLDNPQVEKAVRTRKKAAPKSLLNKDSAPASPRVEVPEKVAAVVSRIDFEKDWERGYAITFYNPARVEILKDPRSGQEIRRELPADLNYCCMRCKFSTTVKETLDKHFEAADEHKHCWTFDPFTNPYGHFMDVVIEGIDKFAYDSIVKERSA